MKINIISHSDLYGGAARAAYRLHTALRKNNISSEMLVTRKLSDDYTVLNYSAEFSSLKNQAINYISQKLQSVKKNRGLIPHSLNIFGSDTFDLIKKSNADIVNLHWINAETLSVKQISKIDKPIVMTLHDMWAFCGTEHLSTDTPVSNFRVGYSNKYFNLKNGFDTNKLIWNLKKKYWTKKFTIVTPSKWLTDCAKSSDLFLNWDVYTIPNALDTDIYKPIDNCIARDILKLPQNKKLIGFGAMSCSSKEGSNKGFDLLEKALKELYDKDYCCVIFGQSVPQEIPELGFPVYFLGHLHDDPTLALFYNAIDVMVVPSRQEAFGQTASEALSCGTPVVAFRTTGLIDIITHQLTGYLAEPFNTKDLAKGIEWCLDKNTLHNLSKNARERAINLWSMDIIANKYSELYNSILKNSE